MPARTNCSRWQMFTFGEFLERYAADFAWPHWDAKALVQGHCHQKAIMGMSSELALYRRLGLDFQLLDSGCCGMAGAFGFENRKA